MSFSTLGVIALGIYIGGLVVMAVFARRARVDLGPADHFLAGRGLGAFVLFLTLYATAYSGNSLLGYPGEAYRRGYSFIMATGFMMSIIVVFHALVPRLRPVAITHGFVTPGDWVRHRFGAEPASDRVATAVSILMAIALANFLFAQLVAMGIVVGHVTDHAIPEWAGVIGLAGFILFYETFGGMRAVAWTDAVQGILMLVGLAFLLSWLLGESGGLSGITAELARVRPEALAVPDARECANWASTVALLGLASVVYPQAIQRVYAARSGASLKRALSLMSFMPLTTTLVVTLIGIAAIPRFAHLDRLGADAVMPSLLAEWATAGPGATLLAILVFVGALAAIMSTADSVLLSLGSILAIDLFGRSNRDPETTHFGKRAAMAVMFVAVILALVPGLTLWRLLELKMELLIQCVPAFLLALHWPGLRASATFYGIAAGGVVAIGGALVGFGRIGGVHIGVLGLGVNLLVAVGWSVMSAPPGRKTA